RLRLCRRSEPNKFRAHRQAHRLQVRNRPRSPIGVDPGVVDLSRRGLLFGLRSFGMCGRFLLASRFRETESGRSTQDLYRVFRETLESYEDCGSQEAGSLPGNKIWKPGIQEKF